LATNHQENISFPWLPNKTAKEMLISLAVYQNSQGNEQIPWRFLSSAKKYIFPWLLNTTTKKIIFSLAASF